VDEVTIYFDLDCGHKKAWVYSVTRLDNGTMIYKMECSKCGHPQTKHFTQIELNKKENDEKT